MGSEFVDHTPKWLKILAIQLFGTSDKVVLKVGMISTIAGLALVSGSIARRNRNLGLAIIVVFGVLGGAVSSNRPSQSVITFIPSLFGAAIGCWALSKFSTFISQHDRPIETPGESRAPLGWDRRRFISAASKTVLTSAIFSSVASRLESNKISDIRN